jgi:Late embryogenesis abundant protein
MKKKLSITLVITVVVLAIATVSCLQLQQMQNMAKCEFRINKVENIQLANINIQNIKSYQDLSILDATKITAAVAGGTLPLSLRLNLDVKNPNATTAAMNKLEWILMIDDIQMLEGISNQKVSIAPNATSSLPLDMRFDLKEVLSGESGSTLLNFAFNLADAGGAPTRITLKAKPTIMVGSIPITYPGYINIKKDFTSN